MSSAESTPPPVRVPSVFISYASEDRAAARALRDALLATGLDVWYDENELTGGDAWDQKIRRQIRDCDYFMPVISATTERRKEGYFRREWRLAAERTMDMADDVLFLVPVVIDDTQQTAARVPDKFLTVQWLRAPGGQPTPALEALALRLLAGEHHIAPRRSVTAPPIPLRGDPTPPPLTPPAPAAPPPMPPFPHAPEKGGLGQWLKFFAEAAWWVVTAVWLVFTRLPRWVRWLIIVWILLTVWGPCRPRGESSRKLTAHDEARIEAEVEKAIQAAAQMAADAFKDKEKDKDPSAPPKKRDPARIASKIGEEMARRYGGKVADAVPKPLLVTPFARESQDSPAGQFAQGVFSSCYGHLLLAGRTDAVISPVLPGVITEAALATVGKRAHADFVLGAHIAKSEENKRTLAVRLVRSEDGTVAWSADYPINVSEAPDTGTKIAQAILPLLPPKKK